MTNCLIVTGAAGELGIHVLRQALAHPKVDRVIATSRSRPIRELSDKLVVLPDVDLAHESGVQVLCEALKQVGDSRIGLLHCAGSFPPAGPLHKTSLNDLCDVFRDNLMTFLGTVQAIVPHMREVKWGRLVAFTSHTQDAAYPFIGPFSLSKAALWSAIKTIANENARFGITCNAIAVATLKTETERRIKPSGRFDDWVPVEGLAAYAVEMALSEVAQVNGSEIQYWQYSDSFFQQSVFDRNSIDMKTIDI